MSILSDSLENLEQIPKTVVKQMAKLPSDIATQAVKTMVGVKNDSGQTGGKRVDPLTGIELSSKQQFQQMQKQEKKRKQAAIPHAQQIIQAISQQSAQGGGIPAYISGKPGFDQDKAIKQMSGETLPQKKELPPPIAAVKKKFSTNERRGGVSG